MPDKSLDWPGSAVSKSTDGVALNLDLVVWLNSFKQEAYRFPRVFGDEFGDEFGDSLNFVSKLVTHLVMISVNHCIW